VLVDSAPQASLDVPRVCSGPLREEDRSGHWRQGFDLRAAGRPSGSNPRRAPAFRPCGRARRFPTPRPTSPVAARRPGVGWEAGNADLPGSDPRAVRPEWERCREHLSRAFEHLDYIRTRVQS